MKSPARRSTPSALCLGALPFALCLSVSVASVRAQAPGVQDQGAVGTATPEFKKDSAKEAFDRGLELYREGEYKKASKQFKTAGKGGKKKADKALVASWGLACKGMQRLEMVRQLAEKRKQVSRAYEMLLVDLPKYRATPAGAEFLKLYSELEAQIFVPLEDFDTARPRIYSKKFGKTLIKDPSAVVKGTALHWTNSASLGKPSQLKIDPAKMVSLRNWEKFEALEFWVNVRAPFSGQIILTSATVDEQKAKGGRPPPGVKPGTKVAPVLMSKLTLKPTKGAWKYIRIPLSSFDAQAGASLTVVKEIKIQVPQTSRPFDLFVDEIRLRKRGEGKGDKKSTRRR